MPIIGIYIRALEAVPNTGWCIATVETTVKMSPATALLKLRGTGLEIDVPNVVVWGPARRFMRVPTKELLTEISRAITDTLKDIIIDWAAVQKEP
jgi:hypothetical protein